MLVTRPKEGPVSVQPLMGSGPQAAASPVQGQKVDPYKPPASEITAYEDVIEAGSTAKQSISEIKTHLANASGPFPGGWVGTPTRQRISTLYANLWERVNKLNKNGVMNEGDLAQVKKLLPDPTSWGEIATGPQIRAALDQVNGLIDQRVSAATERARRQRVVTKPAEPAPGPIGPPPAPIGPPPAPDVNALLEKYAPQKAAPSPPMAAPPPPKAAAATNTAPLTARRIRRFNPATGRVE
jgi:hypothetical protein